MNFKQKLKTPVLTTWKTFVWLTSMWASLELEKNKSIERISPLSPPSRKGQRNSWSSPILVHKEWVFIFQIFFIEKKAKYVVLFAPSAKSGATYLLSVMPVWLLSWLFACLWSVTENARFHWILKIPKPKSVSGHFEFWDTLSFYPSQNWYYRSKLHCTELRICQPNLEALWKLIF